MDIGTAVVTSVGIVSGVSGVIAIFWKIRGGEHPRFPQSACDQISDIWQFTNREGLIPVRIIKHQEQILGTLRDMSYVMQSILKITENIAKSQNDTANVLARLSEGRG